MGQLEHVRKGCLSRNRSDIRSDGSRIEGLHKAMGLLMKSHSCGLENMLALMHDFVLRRNIRIAINLPREHQSDFVVSTHGSHHIALVDFVARQWNRLLIEHVVAHRSGSEKGKDMFLPELRHTDTGEMFGLVFSHNMASFGGKLSIKEEPDLPAPEEVHLHEPMNQEDILRNMNIDPALALVPEGGTTGNFDDDPKAVSEHRPGEATARGTGDPTPETSRDARRQTHEVIVSRLVP